MEKQWWKSKTLYTVAAVLITAGLDIYGYAVPKEAYVILAALGAAFLRLGNSNVVAKSTK